MSGWRGLRGVWPAVLVCGGSFAIVQFCVEQLRRPELVDIVGGLVSIAALALFCRVWQPQEAWEFADGGGAHASRGAVCGGSASAAGSACRWSVGDSRQPDAHASDAPRVARAWMPWVFLSVIVIVWGLGRSRRS